VTPGGLLGVEQLAVNSHIEYALGPCGQSQGFDDVLIVGENIRDRAHGAREVVSRDAILEVDHMLGHPSSVLSTTPYSRRIGNRP